VIISAANANDATMLEAVLDDIPAIRMPSGRRRRGWPRCMPTRPTTIVAAGPICVGVGSTRDLAGRVAAAAEVGVDDLWRLGAAQVCDLLVHKGEALAATLHALIGQCLADGPPGGADLRHPT
jgi:hypothetical protein